MRERKSCHLNFMNSTRDTMRLEIIILCQSSNIPGDYKWILIVYNDFICTHTTSNFVSFYARASGYCLRGFNVTALKMIFFFRLSLLTPWVFCRGMINGSSWSSIKIDLSLSLFYIMIMQCMLLHQCGVRFFAELA